MNTSRTKEIEILIDLIAKLPGLGPRSARRAVLHLIRKKSTLFNPLSKQMAKVFEQARECLNCGNIGTSEMCEICEDQKRINGQICIVEDVSDLWAMERTSVYKGRYHVLGGTLSALDGIGPNELKIPKLIKRLDSEEVHEVILALNATLEGQTTAHYIAEQIENKVSVTSLARGVPMGGELDYLDEGTISAALNARGKI
ncbi:recombination mediator RecR [Paracoccaceae bacterium]|nr:recombination mediator RecR [Paracoccaceae bacterium]